MRVYLLTSFLIMDNEITAAFTSIEKLEEYKKRYREFHSEEASSWQPFDPEPTVIELDPVFDPKDPYIGT